MSEEKDSRKEVFALASKKIGEFISIGIPKKEQFVGFILKHS
jgi:hypothetical protein